MLPGSTQIVLPGKAFIELVLLQDQGCWARLCPETSFSFRLDSGINGHAIVLQCIAAGQKAEVSHGLTYLIGTLVATTVAALHGVASGHPHLSPHHYPGCRGPRFLHKEAATAHGKRWCKFIKDFGKSLQLRKSNYGELQKIESMHH